MAADLKTLRVEILHLAGTEVTGRAQEACQLVRRVLAGFRGGREIQFLRRRGKPRLYAWDRLSLPTVCACWSSRRSSGSRRKGLPASRPEISGFFWLQRSGELSSFS